MRINFGNVQGNQIIKRIALIGLLMVLFCFSGDFFFLNDKKEDGIIIDQIIYNSPESSDQWYLDAKTGYFNTEIGVQKSWLDMVKIGNHFIMVGATDKNGPFNINLYGRYDLSSDWSSIIDIESATEEYGSDIANDSDGYLYLTGYANRENSSYTDDAFIMQVDNETHNANWVNFYNGSVVAYNEDGMTLSNNIEINVERPFSIMTIIYIIIGAIAIGAGFFVIKSRSKRTPDIELTLEESTTSEDVKQQEELDVKEPRGSEAEQTEESDIDESETEVDESETGVDESETGVDESETEVDESETGVDETNVESDIDSEFKNNSS
ncbi:MAG: hypothetical protein GF364_08720 [Candidatus Lokiarchaeota archaeon]|nr:hypothetical protein [Candidatus Lokiarchaeota archaeon]